VYKSETLPAAFWQIDTLRMSVTQARIHHFN